MRASDRSRRTSGISMPAPAWPDSSRRCLRSKHGTLPPTIHGGPPNPAIDFPNSPFFVNSTLRPWARPSGPRRAAVSSFGIGGTNAHVVLEEPPDAPTASGTPRTAELLILSAKSERALDESAANLATHLRAQPALSLADVALTLRCGRSSMPHRRAAVCRDIEEAAAALEKASGRRSRRGGLDLRPSDLHVSRSRLAVSGDGPRVVCDTTGVPASCRCRGRDSEAFARFRPATDRLGCRHRRSAHAAAGHADCAAGDLHRLARARAARDELGSAASGDDRTQHRRVRGRLPVRRVFVRGCASPRPGARSADGGRSRWLHDGGRPFG